MSPKVRYLDISIPHSIPQERMFSDSGRRLTSLSSYDSESTRSLCTSAEL